MHVSVSMVRNYSLMPSGKRKSALVALSHLKLDDSSERTLRQSLYICIRRAIVEGDLEAGARLPSTRILATELRISRNSVSDAFAQLVADGFLVSHHGSGTFVSDTDLRQARATNAPTAWERVSIRGKLFARRSPEDSLKGRPSFPFQPGLPSYENFPFETWARIASRVLRHPSPDLLGYGDSAGYKPLRESIAAELRSRGGQSCRDDQVVIVGGTSQALDIVARLTLDPGDDVWIEEPSSLYVRQTLASAGANLIPVAVDDDGLNVDRGIEKSPRARLAHVTSAHQWPLGATLSESRRRQMLQWADDADAWIVEDEYDGTFRYDGSRPTSLRAMSKNDRVISIGTFSVTTFPSIRLGYIVAPSTLVDAFVAAKATADRQASLFEQAILANFIYDGHYAKHKKLMEGVYAERQRKLIEQIANFDGPTIAQTASGLHIILPLESDVDDRAVSALARTENISAPPLSTLYLTQDVRSGLVLGFGAGSVASMEAAAAKLCRNVLKAPRARLKPRLRLDVPG